MIQIGQYKFCQHSDNKTSKGPKKRWICSYVTCRGCRAFLVTVDAPVFTTSIYGNPIIQIGKYKFGLHNDKRRTDPLKKRWSCNLRGNGCKAYIVTLENEIIAYRNEHNH
ncbi:FLYWCH zinc finger domain-containing protein [Phthorimaea operculella]|nr:FLYWCH zinc finger domain-containing protein [Phthorimaea operculella]